MEGFGRFQRQDAGHATPHRRRAFQLASSAPRHKAVIAAKMERRSAKITANNKLEFILMSFLRFPRELHTELLGLLGGWVGAHAAGAAALKCGELVSVFRFCSFIYLFCIYLDLQFLKREADRSFGHRSPARRSSLAVAVCACLAFLRLLQNCLWKVKVNSNKRILKK